MNSARRKEPMSSLIRAHSEVVRRMEAGAAGAKFIEVEANANDPTVKAMKNRTVSAYDSRIDDTPKRTYSIVTDDRQTGWYDPDYGVRCDQTGLLMNEEPLSTRKAQELLERLEEGE